MPLDNTAKLSDIITALQTFEAINAKADLASVIGSPATADDTMATLVSLIQQSKNTLATKMDDGSTGAEPLQTLVGNLVIGKKWANGTTTSSTSETYFPSLKGYARTLTVTGVGFQPSFIFLMIPETVQQTRALATIFYADMSTNDNDILYAAATNLLMSVDGTLAFVRENSFQLPVYHQSTTYSWIAFE